MLMHFLCTVLCGLCVDKQIWQYFTGKKICHIMMHLGSCLTINTTIHEALQRTNNSTVSHR